MTKIENYKGNDLVVYFHINPIKQEIFYVGFGYTRRPYSKCGHTKWWHRTIKKYGIMVVIAHENLNITDAVSLERKYIKQIGRRDLKLGTLINMTDGGEGSFGFKHTEETKEKLRRVKRSQELKNRLSIIQKDLWNKKTEKEKKENQINQKNIKTIIQKDLAGNFIKTWVSLRQIERELGFFRFNLNYHLSGKGKHAYGYLWEYEIK